MKKWKKRFDSSDIGRWLLGILLTLVLICPASAQEDESGNADDGFMMLEEVVVTAERRESTVQKTPIPITALKGTDMTAKAQFVLDEALLSAPGVILQAGLSGSQVFIRGVGSNVVGFGDPAINLSIDGVYQQDGAAVTGGLFDVERVEVLRGPQGTLYGRNATAGSINVVTNDPVEVFEGYAGMTMSNYDGFRTEGMLNVPITSGIAVRGAFYTDRHEGYLQPSGYNDADQMGGRLKVLFDRIDRMRLVLTGSFLLEGGEGVGAVNTGIDDRSNPWHAERIAGVIDHKFWDVRAQLDWDFGGSVLTVIPAYVSAERIDNNSTMPASVVNPGMGESPAAQGELTTQTSFEARLASSETRPFSWVAGVFYLDGEYSKTDFVRAVLQDTNIFDPGLFQKQPVTAYGAFGQVTYSLTDTFRLTGGLRYTADEKEQHNEYTDLTTRVTTTSPVFPVEWDSVDYKVGVELDVTPDSMVYATLSTAYKAGGFAARVPAGVASVSFDPEELIAYEFGTKNRFINGSLQVNASAYYYDYTNYQTRYRNIIDGQLFVLTANAGESEIYGGEVESIYQISRSDRLDANIAYTHAEFGTMQYVDATGLRDFSNQTMPNAPECVGMVGYEHVWAFENQSSLTARVETRLSSSFWSTIERSQDSEQPGYHLSNASFTFDSSDRKWSVSAFVKNIEDEPVRASGGFAPPDRGFLWLQAPRTYGISIISRF